MRHVLVHRVGDRFQSNGRRISHSRMAVIVLSAFWLISCSVGIPYTVEEKGDAPFQTETSVLPEQVEKLEIISEDNHYSYRVFGELSEISYYSRTTTKRILNPINTAVGIGLTPFAFLDGTPESPGLNPGLAADTIKKAVVGIAQNTDTTFDNPIKDVKSLGHKDTISIPGSGAAYVVRATDGTSAIEGSGVLNPDGKLPISEDDIRKQFAEQYGHDPENLSWTVKVTQAYTTVRDGVENTHTFEYTSVKEPLHGVTVSGETLHATKRQVAITFLTNMRQVSLASDFGSGATVPTCEYRDDAMRVPDGSWASYAQWRFSVLQSKGGPGQPYLFAVLVGEPKPSTSADSESQSPVSPFSTACQAYGRSAAVPDTAIAREMRDVVTALAVLGERPLVSTSN